MTDRITPVPLPAPGEELTNRPTPDEVALTAAGVVGAVTPPGGLTRVQHVVLFLLFYYIMTLIHAFHLIIGIVLVAVLAVQTHRGRFGADYNSPVEVGGLYWHFVDVIWLFLLPLLYLVSARGP